MGENFGRKTATSRVTEFMDHPEHVYILNLAFAIILEA